jgi:hypothetical protein
VRCIFWDVDKRKNEEGKGKCLVWYDSYFAGPVQTNNTKTEGRRRQNRFGGACDDFEGRGKEKKETEEKHDLECHCVPLFSFLAFCGPAPVRPSLNGGVGLVWFLNHPLLSFCFLSFQKSRWWW